MLFREAKDQKRARVVTDLVPERAPWCVESYYSTGPRQGMTEIREKGARSFMRQSLGGARAARDRLHGRGNRGAKVEPHGDRQLAIGHWSPSPWFRTAQLGSGPRCYPGRAGLFRLIFPAVPGSRGRFDQEARKLDQG